MILTIMLIAGLEILAISCFLAGHVLGRQFERGHKCILPKVELSEDVLDPVTPEDQMLIKKMEEATVYGQVQREED